MIGFVESEFQGEERGEAHSVLAGYISGLPDNRIISYAPTSITASEETQDTFLPSIHPCMHTLHFLVNIDLGGDVIVASSGIIRPISSAPLASVFFTLRVDGVSQEMTTSHLH